MAASIAAKSSFRLSQGTWSIFSKFQSGTCARQETNVAPSPITFAFTRCSSSDAKDELYRRMIVEVKGHDPAVLKSYENFTSLTASELGIQVESITSPPKIISRRSLLKSVFVHKKHFHQYENATHFRVFEFKHITGSTASTFLEYIQRNLPEGMAMKVTKHQLHPLPSHLKPPDSSKIPTSSEDSPNPTASLS